MKADQERRKPMRTQKIGRRLVEKVFLCGLNVFFILAAGFAHSHYDNAK
jgi:hypothetical protein